MKNTDKITMTIKELKKMVNESKYDSNEYKFNKFKKECQEFIGWLNETLDSIETEDIELCNEVTLWSYMDWVRKGMKQIRSYVFKLKRLIE